MNLKCDLSNMFSKTSWMTKITVRGGATTTSIPTDIVYNDIAWGLIGAVWDSEQGYFVCTYERTSNKITKEMGSVQEIDKELHFK